MRRDITEKLPFPIHLDIEVSSFCQLNCRMCPYRKMTRAHGFMEISLAEKIFIEAAGQVQDVYLHHMGEPLLHTQFEEFVKLAKQANCAVSASTNAILLTPARTESLIKAGLDNLVISLDAFTKETYLLLRGDYFEQVMGNVLHALQIAKDYGKKDFLDIQLIQTKDNEQEVSQFKQYYDDLFSDSGAGKVIIKPMVTWAGNIPKEWRVSLEYSDFVCTMLNYSMTIEWDGDVVVCCHDYDKFTKMGNVKDSSIQEIWDGVGYDKLRTAHKSKDFPALGYCRGCYENEHD